MSEKAKKSNQASRRRDFAFYDFLILAIAIAVFLAGWYGITKGSNIFVAGSFYSKGFYATYQLEGTIARKLGGSLLEIETVAADDETATLNVKVGGKTNKLVVNRDTAKVLEDTQINAPLIYYYDLHMEPWYTSATFGNDKKPYFSSEFTGLDSVLQAHVKQKNSDNMVLWYHRSEDRSYGPQYSWELNLYDEMGKNVGTIVNDSTSGVLLNARFYQDGLGTANLLRTNYPTSLNRQVIFCGMNLILVLWGIFHLVRAKRHRQEWEAHPTYFPLNFAGISKFYIRLMAFTIFDFLGVGVQTGNLNVLLVTDLIGLALMIYAVGGFAFPVVFKFLPWIAPLLVLAVGRPLDYVQYPFGIPLYLIAVVMYEINKFLVGKKNENLALGTGKI
ncbi:MAG: hypothetical protein PHO53_04980 [Actinomycetota bacterium]|nr:hypothetical protein [Actinomycetota bacterium]